MQSHASDCILPQFIGPLCHQIMDPKAGRCVCNVALPAHLKPMVRQGHDLAVRDWICSPSDCASLTPKLAVCRSVELFYEDSSARVLGFRG
jgi:hypothetical protein